MKTALGQFFLSLEIPLGSSTGKPLDLHTIYAVDYGPTRYKIMWLTGGLFYL